MNENVITDEELVQKSLKDIEFFAELFERYEQKLMKYILRISAFSYEQSEEILQESFIKAWKNLQGFDKDLSFSTWIYRIVHNTTISEWKKTQTKNKDLIYELTTQKSLKKFDLKNNFVKLYFFQSIFYSSSYIRV